MAVIITPILLLLMIVPVSLGAQEPVVPQLLSRNLPYHVMRYFPVEMSVMPDSHFTMVYPMRVRVGAANDYTLSYRSPEKKINIRNFSREITIERHLSLNQRNPHRISMFFIEDLSQVKIRSLSNANAFRTENRSRQWGLSYSRDFWENFGFQVCVGKMNGVNGGQWTYGAGLRLVNEHIVCSFDAGRKFHSHESSICYSPDTVLVPADYAETEYRIGLMMKNINKTDLEFNFTLSQFDSENRKINRFSALLDGTAETAEARVSRFFRKGVGFIHVRRNAWDYQIYTSKNDQSYGKFNVPETEWTEITAGMQYQLNSDKAIQAAYRYGYGIEHIGMIIDSWPFTSTLVDLLGVKNYNSVDGNIRLHSVFMQAAQTIGSRHHIEPGLGFIIAGIKGRYAYRKQDAFFYVFDRGEYRMNEHNQYVNAGLSYRFVSDNIMIRFRLHQLIPVGKDKSLFDAEKVKAYGGLFGRLSLSFGFF